MFHCEEIIVIYETINEFTNSVGTFRISCLMFYFLKANELLLDNAFVTVKAILLVN